MIDTKKLALALTVLTIISLGFMLALTAHAGAEVIDRIVAYVDDDALTLGELEENFRLTQRVIPDITRDEVLNTMINRILLLREAHRLRLEAEDDDRLIEEYIEIKVRAFIRIDRERAERFYNENKDTFKAQGFDEAREEVEIFLREKEVNVKLRQHLETLRRKALIKTQL